MTIRNKEMALFSVLLLFLASTTYWFSTSVGGRTYFDGASYDYALYLRAQLGIVPPERQATDRAQHVAVVLSDERSLLSSEFSNLPRVLLTPYWAEIIEGLVSAGATVVAFDMIFSYSASDYVENYDMPFLQALHRHRARIVLGRSGRHGPHQRYLFALGAQENTIGHVELIPDDDGIFRHVQFKDHDVQGLGNSLIYHAIDRVAGSDMVDLPQDLTLAPWGPMEQIIPGYSMVDVLRATRAQAAAAMRAAFAGRVVLIGTSLAEEDRKSTPDESMQELYQHQPLQESPLPLLTNGLSLPGSGTVPGVYVHALAVEQVLDGLWMQDQSVESASMVAVLLVVMLVSVLYWAPLPWAMIGATACIFAVVAYGVFALDWLIAVPTFMFISCLLVAALLTYGARFFAAQQKQRAIQNTFGHYLAPTVVARLIEQGGAPSLSGERRTVSVMFADLSGFTALSERVSPEELMEQTNAYLADLVESVESTGGYVDKFIGDAVMAIWGAPADDPLHGFHAVMAARRGVEAVAKRRAESIARGEDGFFVKIGVHTGPAVIGNVGARNRFNYTAVGETVNVAARLEGLPGKYGCNIAISHATRDHIYQLWQQSEGADAPKAAMPDDPHEVQQRWQVHELMQAIVPLDKIQVKGKSAALDIYDVLPYVPFANDVQMQAYRQHMVRAYAAYQAGDFAAAAALYHAIVYPSALDATHSYQVIKSGGATPPQIMAARALAFQAAPPPQPWKGVWTLQEK